MKKIVLIIFAVLFYSGQLFSQFITAEDNASNYDTWSDGNNNGFGFAAWNLWTDGNSGHFLKSASGDGFGDIDTGGKSFGMWGNTSGSDYSHAKRAVSNWSNGAILTIDIAIAYRNGNKGIDLYATGDEHIYNFNASEDQYKVQGGNLGWDYSQTSIFQLKVEQNGSNVDITVTRGVNTDLKTIVGKTLEFFKLYCGNTESGDLNNLYFNNLQIEYSDPTEVPSAANVEINGIIVLSSDETLTVNDLTIGGGNTFTIQSNASGTGSLITNGTVSGSVTFQRYITAWSDASHGWHFLASPVATFDINGSDFDPGENDDLYGWAESTGLWMNHKAGDPTQIVPGTGYFTSWQATDTKNFSGTLNNSNISKSNLSFTEGSTNTGWHLLGNPFPCALKWATSWSLSNVNTTAKIWNESSASYSDITSGETIPATQAFMVYVSNATNSLTIPTADRTHNSQAWYKDEEINKIKLTAYDPEGNTAQESIIKFNENATASFDNEFDSYFLAGYAPQFYSVINDEFAVSTNTLTEISEQLSIPFSFIKNSSSNFYIEVEGIDNIFPQTLVSLVDLKTNTTQNLLENPVYTFESSEGDDAERFLIQFGVLGLEEESLENKLNFYVYNNTLNIVNNDLKNGKIQVFDMFGRQVLEKRISGQENSINLNLPAANYVVRIISEKNIINRKIHID